VPWFSSFGGDFNTDFGVTVGEDESSGTSVFFLRDGDSVYRTNFTTGRGDELLGGVWSFLDLTSLGRQKLWENSPEGWPQTPPMILVASPRSRRRIGHRIQRRETELAGPRNPQFK
jgi:hypothetical protein